MTSRPHAMTVQELYDQLGQLLADDKRYKRKTNRYADRVVMVSDDEEGNGFHCIWYDVTAKSDKVEALKDSVACWAGPTAKNCIIVG